MKYKKLLIVFTFYLPFILFAHSSNQLSKTEQQIVHYLQQKKTEQLLLLKKLVNINSGTENIKGIYEVGEILRPQFEALGFKTRWVKEPESLHRAATLIAERKGKIGKRLLLIGHLDTVFPKNSPFQQIKWHKNVAIGPGVIDDKGGIIIILYALKALHAAHALDNTTITIVLTGDEENSGKPTSISRKPLVDAAKKSDIALDFEPTSPGNAASIGRRGISHWLIQAKGREGHSSAIFSSDLGDGAIFELTRILNEMRIHLSHEKYLTFNPGMILGGMQINVDHSKGEGNSQGKNNVISKIAMASGDLRYLSLEQKNEAEKKIRAIVSNHLPGTSATVKFDESLPPMPPTEANLKLLKQYSEISEKLGYGPVNEITPELRGAGDISFIASYVSASLVGIGATGTGMHSQHETLEINSLIDRSERAALLIYALTR